MVVVSNDTAAAAPLKQKAFQRAEILAPQRDHEFERSKLLTATLSLVTRMFLLGLFSQDAPSSQKRSVTHRMLPEANPPFTRIPSRSCRSPRISSKTNAIDVEIAGKQTSGTRSLRCHSPAMLLMTVGILTFGVYRNQASFSLLYYVLIDFIGFLPCKMNNIERLGTEC